MTCKKENILSKHCVLTEG